MTSSDIERNSEMHLNARAWQLVEGFAAQPSRSQVEVSTTDDGVMIVDCGVQARGGLLSGVAMAKACLADLASVQVLPGRSDIFPGQAVQVYTDQPVAACMASQYAGWQIAGDKPTKFFAMGSGPMRAAYGGEVLFDEIGFRESADCAVGVLETSRLPPDAVCREIADKCGVRPDRLALLVAPTASLAGSVQVVARSLETCLHKLHELAFDLSRVRSGYGVAPLPPVAADDMMGIGWTNDAVLYGGDVTLWVDGDDTTLEEIGPKIPSSASRDHGQPFADIFARYDHDFYKIDPLLFSPAVVTLVNVDTGYSRRFGEFAPLVLRDSFGRR